MRFNISKLSEIFMYISIFYLIFFPFNASFVTFIILINSILISYDTVGYSTTNYFGMYRSFNRLDFFWINITNCMKNTVLPYFIITFFVTALFYINNGLYFATLIITTMILVYLIINLLISIFNCFMIESSKIIIFILLFLSINFLISYLGNPITEIYLRSLSIYSWHDDYTLIQFLKLGLILLVYLILKIIERYRRNEKFR